MILSACLCFAYYTLPTFVDAAADTLPQPPVLYYIGVGIMDIELTCVQASKIVKLQGAHIQQTYIQANLRLVRFLYCIVLHVESEVNRQITTASPFRERRLY